MTAPTDAVFEMVCVRDFGRCAKCGSEVSGRRGFDFSLHHRRPRGAGGSKLAWVNMTGNLILLHGSGTTGCHSEVESYRKEALSNGFLVPINGIRKSCEVPILHAVHGRVLLDDYGDFESQAVPF